MQHEQHLKAPLHVAPDGLGQLNGAYGAALLGVRRLERLLADGRPVPPTAAQQGAAAPTRRRWSAAAVRKRVEPCANPADCPIVLNAAAKTPTAAVS